MEPESGKKIILTVGRGMIVRNLLQNDFYRRLRERCQVVILSPAAKEEEFVKAFGGAGVSFVEMKEIPHSFRDRICVGLQRYLLFDRFMGLKARYGIRGVSRPDEASLFRYVVYVLIFTPLAKIGFLKKAVRWFDFHFVQRQEVEKFQALLKRENPAAVMISSILSNVETALTKAAKRSGIPVVGMVKSWDNPSKMGVRVVPDLMAVWSDFMAGQFVKLQLISRERVRIVGVPQFDDYADESFRWPREKFCQEFGLDPDRKIILYTSAGKGVPEDSELVSYVIDFIAAGAFEGRPQLLIRPHFKYRNDYDKFRRYEKISFVAIDKYGLGRSLQSFRDQTDFSREHTERFINTLYHSALVINVASTTTFDAAAFGKPAIHPMFTEPLGGKPQGDSYLMFYESDYIKALQHTGAVETPRSKDEFREAISRSLRRPDFRVGERQAMIEKFCYRIDGQSGRRLAEALLGMVPE